MKNLENRSKKKIKFLYDFLFLTFVLYSSPFFSTRVYTCGDDFTCAYFK